MNGGFILDLGRCVGCGACVLACRLENRWPEGVEWRRILPLNLGRRAGGPVYHFSLACHHCDEPACLKACPTGAFEKLADGSVLLHQEICLGCRYCEMACPYGAPSYDAASGVMTKCHMCHRLLDEGLQPACVAACPTNALSAASGLGKEPRLKIPGFPSGTGCKPNLRFVAPGGQVRRLRLQELEKELEP